MTLSQKAIKKITGTKRESCIVIKGVGSDPLAHMRFVAGQHPGLPVGLSVKWNNTAFHKEQERVDKGTGAEDLVRCEFSTQVGHVDGTG